MVLKRKRAGGRTGYPHVPLSILVTEYRAIRAFHNWRNLAMAAPPPPLQFRNMCDFSHKRTYSEIVPRNCKQEQDRSRRRKQFRNNCTCIESSFDIATTRWHSKCHHDCVKRLTYSRMQVGVTKHMTRRMKADLFIFNDWRQRWWWWWWWWWWW